MEKLRTSKPTHLAALFTANEARRYPPIEGEKNKEKNKRSAKPRKKNKTQSIFPTHTEYIQPALPLDKPLRSRLCLSRIRQVDRKPDELARMLSHPFLFHPRDRILRFFLAPRGKVHPCPASHEVERNVQTDTRTLISQKAEVSSAVVPRKRTKYDRPSVAGDRADALGTGDDGHATVQVEQVSLWGNVGSGAAHSYNVRVQKL